jgi:putative tryptophan/tyrosine transport system substrate-binding protein
MRGTPTPKRCSRCFAKGSATSAGLTCELQAAGAAAISSARPCIELVALSPDVIFAYFNAQLGPLARTTRSIPIVFVGASDPVGAGYIASLPHPGGNITGFTLYEPTLAGKWLGILKEVAPHISRIALLINPDTAVVHGTLYAQAVEAAAASVGIETKIAKPPLDRSASSPAAEWSWHPTLSAKSTAT